MQKTRQIDTVMAEKNRFRTGNYWFPIRKGGLFCPGQEIKGLCGGVHRYAAQASPKIDAAWAKKNPFRIWSPPFLQGLFVMMIGTGLLPYIRPLFERTILSGLDEICAYRPYRTAVFFNRRKGQVFNTLV